jgi:RNA polymerase sigma-70 factor (ECF subfamily)
MEARRGPVCMLEGKSFSVMVFTVRGGKIVEIDILSDPERLAQLDLTGALTSG